MASSTATPGDLIALIAPGSQVVVRDEEWIVRSTQQTPNDGVLVRCIGTSTLVRDTEAAFVTDLDHIEPLRPRDTVLVADDSPNHRRARLYLEAMLRKTPVPGRATGLAVTDRQLLDRLEYQRRAVAKALDGLRPRLLIGDAVGLGKTLEVGAILSELIRRGRGEKILVVTPRHILEQFQHELWTRFAIPLVRLDSAGIQRVRREIPANRNPFTHFKRAIISIDTLKNAGRYRHHLEGIRWGAVVIDECHALVNKGTLNNQLAKVLAPRTEALLLTSATPHNGDPASFAELIGLLDPTAVVDPEHLTSHDIAHLYVRRHKHHDEVEHEVTGQWAEREPPRSVLCDATDRENALLDELTTTWTHPAQGTAAPTSGQGASLFPWTLFKAAMSSHHALRQTIATRRATLAGRDGATDDAATAAEDVALARLDELAAAIGDADASKLAALVEQLREIGVGPSSPTRVVVFSERIATLDWLAETVPAQLGLRPEQVRVLHGGMADVTQMDVIEEFGLAEAPVRLLLTGDMASEGVNLHRQCHHLVHFDLPWSLITIEQRNGRIDRYGQARPPGIRSLLLLPSHPDASGDARILTRLLEREHHAHRQFGEAGSLMGLHVATLEEEHVARALRDREDLATVVPEEPEDDFDLMALLQGDTGDADVPKHPVPSLFADDRAFVDEALRFAFHDPATALELRGADDDPGYLSLVPPEDLVRRLTALPGSYLREQEVTDRLRITASTAHADAALQRARDDTGSTWPSVGHLSPLHPLLDWLVDKVLAGVGRNEAPVVHADLDAPTFLVLGSCSNGRGQPQVVEWMAVAVRPDGARVSDLFDTLDAAGVRATMPNPGTSVDLPALTACLPDAIAAARQHLVEQRDAHDAELAQVLAGPRRRLEAWTAGRRQRALDLDDRYRSAEQRRVDDVEADTQALIDSMRTEGEPLLRVLAILTGSER